MLLDRFSLQLCLPLGIHELQVKSDALLVVQELTKVEKSMSIWGTLISEIKNLLKRIPKVVVQHRGRMANAAVDCLAKYFWHLHNLIVWWNSYPEIISHIIEHDAMLWFIFLWMKLFACYPKKIKNKK